MRYQLVLQFAAASVDDLDDLVALENALSEMPFCEFEVDGHDMGSSEFNIFLITSNPRKAFAQVEEVIEQKQPRQQLKAAYRAVGAENFIFLWPPNLHDFNVT